MNKILFVRGGDVSIIWTDEEGIPHPSWWLDTKFPEEKGIYVWERGVGVRSPTNKEWWRMIAGNNPVEEDESEIILGDWVKSPPREKVAL